MGKPTKKMLCLMLAAIMMFAIALTGCGEKETEQVTPNTQSIAAEKTEEQQKEAKEDPVELVWATRCSPQDETALVEEELNKRLLPEINATVKLDFIDPGTYAEKIRIKLASNETLDVVFTSSSLADYYGDVAKGAFTELDGLLTEYAPKSYAQIPEAFWDATRVDGKIYGFINYQIAAKDTVFTAQEDYVNKYNFDMSTVKKPQDVEPFLAAVKAGEDASVIPTEGWKQGMWEDVMRYYGFEQIGPAFTPGVIRISDTETKVINQYETDEFKEHILMMRDWYKKGYVIKDSATFTARVQQRGTGKLVSLFRSSKPGGNAEWEAQYGHKIVNQEIAKPIVSTSSVTATMNAIPKSSSDPVRAMKLLELVNSDVEINNMINFGIEDKHYKKVAEKRIEILEDSKYKPNRSWTFGNVFITYLQPGQEDGVWEETIKMNEESIVSPLIGFNFNSEAVNSELTQCLSVFDEYGPGLLTGSVDPEKYLPEFLDKLKTAGFEKILQEEQAQIDAWKK